MCLMDFKASLVFRFCKSEPRRLTYTDIHIFRRFNLMRVCLTAILGIGLGFGESVPWSVIRSNSDSPDVDSAGLNVSVWLLSLRSCWWHFLDVLACSPGNMLTGSNWLGCLCKPDLNEVSPLCLFVSLFCAFLQTLENPTAGSSLKHCYCGGLVPMLTHTNLRNLNQLFKTGVAIFVLSTLSHGSFLDVWSEISARLISASGEQGTRTFSERCWTQKVQQGGIAPGFLQGLCDWQITG